MGHQILALQKNQPGFGRFGWFCKTFGWFLDLKRYRPTKNGSSSCKHVDVYRSKWWVNLGKQEVVPSWLLLLLLFLRVFFLFFFFFCFFLSYSAWRSFWGTCKVKFWGNNSVSRWDIVSAFSEKQRYGDELSCIAGYGINMNKSKWCLETTPLCPWSLVQAKPCYK